MNDTAAKTQARLKWEVACERLSFALQRPAEASPDRSRDVESAVRLAQAALEELRQAFAGDAGSRSDEEA